MRCIVGQASYYCVLCIYCMLLTLTPIISLQVLTLTFMPGSLMHVEVVIYPEPWPIFDDSFKVCFLCETLEMFPCCFIGEAYPSMVEGYYCL